VQAQHSREDIQTWGEGVEYVVEFVDTDTGPTERHRMNLYTAVVIRRYLESRSR